MKKAVPVSCHPRDIIPGDILLLPDNLWTALLRKRGLKYWFSVVTERGRVALKFILNSPLTWHEESMEFRSVVGDAVFRVSDKDVDIYRGMLTEEVRIFENLPSIESVEPISAERIQEIIDGNLSLFRRLLSVTMNEFPRDPYRAVRLFLTNLQDYPHDVRSVFLFHLIKNVSESQVDAIMKTLAFIGGASATDTRQSPSKDAETSANDSESGVWKPIW